MSLRVAFLLVCAALAQSGIAHARKGTVCTITVNSADERDVLRQSLSPEKYDFVELVERGRPDWLASACRRKVSCDVLLVSGHFAGTEFYSSRFTAHETLKVEEIPTQEGFDPNFHEAVMHVADDNLGQNVVADVFQKGYKRGDKVLRCSMVKVAN